MEREKEKERLPLMGRDESKGREVRLVQSVRCGLSNPIYVFSFTDSSRADLNIFKSKFTHIM